MNANEFLLFGENRIALLLERGGAVEMPVKRRLVRDHEIVAVCCSALQNIERRHHCHGDPVHFRLGITCLESVDSVLRKFDGRVLGDPRDHVRGGESI